MIVEDLTTGAISGHFRRLALPAAIGMLFSTLYNIVDTFYAGQLGTTAQAGLAAAFQAFFILIAFGFGLGSALSALVGNARGRKDLEDARHLAAQGIGFAGIISVILMGVALVTGPFLIDLVSEPGAYRDAGLRYFYTLVLALPGFVMAYGCNGILQARGDTQSMQRAMVVAFFANIGLNPLLMYGVPGILPGLGLNGIALATALSQSGVAAYVLWRVFGRNMMQNCQRREFRPVLAQYRAIAGQALPASLALLINFASGFIVLFALKAHGDGALAAYGISLRLEQLFLLPAVGITIALVPIAAQNFGAGAHDRVRDAFRLCWLLGLGATLAAFPFFWFLGGWATSLFSDDPEVIALGALFLKVEAVILPAYVILFSVNSMLQALKQAVWTIWIGVYRQGVGLAILIWLFASVLDWGVFGIRLGIGVAVFTGLLLSLIILRRVVRSTLEPLPHLA